MQGPLSPRWNVFASGSILLLLAAGGVAAESAKAEETLAGHSRHGEVFNEGPRQQAYLMGGTGNVHFPVTTADAQAQKFFDQGVGQLHGFWYFEAERSFRQVLKIDPNCVMAYWGMAMANTDGNEKRAKGFIEKISDLEDSVSKREQLWIKGLADYLLSKEKDQKKRKQAYIRSLENIIHEHPDDVEAKAFLAVRIWQFRNELPISSHQAVDALLDQVFAANPAHPAHHYRIHLWDHEKPERALGSAAQCGQAAPTIAHMWHMPGHTYSRVKRYADAVWQQEASSRADHAHMIRDRVLPDQIHNYAHNQEWLTRNLNHIGRVEHAIDLAKNLIELPRHPKYNTLKKGSASYGRQRLFETLLRYEAWDDLLRLSQSMYLEPTNDVDQQVVWRRAVGVAHAELQHKELLAEQIASLEETKKAQQQEMKKAQEDAVAKLEEKAKADNKKSAEKKETDESDSKDNKDGQTAEAEQPKPQIDEKELQKAKDDAAKPFQDRIKKIDEALAELNGYQKLFNGDDKEALELFNKAKDISKERLAKFHLLAGDSKKAEELASQAVNSGENEIVPLAYYVEILHKVGKADEARKQFDKLRTAAAYLDSLDRPAFQRLAPIAAEFGYPSDWRNQPVAAEDVGERPELASIGPFRWSPSPAPTWALPTSNNQTLSLSDYRGRPVIVIFYLGYGCLHCVEQLQKFAPKAKEFEQAGISLVAVSTDSVEDLKKTIEQSGEKEFPIPLVSDKELNVFRAYRAYDDFESQPLHGTFLIDSSGLVRWQDISYEPFTGADFLLKESNRLLKLSEVPLAQDSAAAE